MSLKIDSTATPKPIIKELENGSKVKFRFIWKDDHFEIETKLYSGTDQPTPCKWPATLKGISNQVTAEELQLIEEFLNKAKFDVCWELNKPVIQIRENEINYNQESTISLQSNNSVVIEQKRIKKNTEPQGNCIKNFEAY